MLSTPTRPETPKRRRGDGSPPARIAGFRGGSSMAVEERVAVVTGGSRGIGRGIVAELAGRGFSVVVDYRSDAEAARAACREAEARGAPRCLALGADVADLGQGRNLLSQALDAFGRV